MTAVTPLAGEPSRAPRRPGKDLVPGRRTRLASRWWWVSGWTLIITAAAVGLGVGAHLDMAPLLVAALLLALYTLPYMALAMTSVARDVTGFLSRRPRAVALLPAAFIASYFIYGLGTGAFSWLAVARIAGFVLAPTVLLVSAGRKPAGAWQDFAAVACIWLPFNFGLLDDIWTWPEGQAAYILNTPMAVVLALVLFLGVRRADYIGFRFHFEKSYAPLVLKGLAGFMALAVPVGMATGFIGWHPKLEAAKIFGQPLAIFFFIAVPEELLFRGLVQNLFVRLLDKRALAVVCASLLFGVSHWHNPGLPDFRYLGLASVAGLFYGWVYLRTGSVAASAVLHAAVDSLWELFFHT